MGAPGAVGEYLTQLVRRLEGMRGIYAVGSLALGAYEQGRSDVDVLAVAAEPLAEAELREIAGHCSHSAVLYPARYLELVVIAAQAAREGRPDWQLNLNTGEGMADHVGLDPSAEPAHWFVLDLALA